MCVSRELQKNGDANLTYARIRDNILPASHAGVVQLVECLLAKEKVVGSSPIARSRPPETGSFLFIGLPLTRHFVSLNESHRPLKTSGNGVFFYRFTADAAFRYTQRVPSPAQDHRKIVVFYPGSFLNYFNWIWVAVHFSCLRYWSLIRSTSQSEN